MRCCGVILLADGKKNKKSAEESAVKNGAKKSSKKASGKKKKRLPGKSNKYERYIKYKLSLIVSWKRLGWSDADIAKRLDVAYSTFKVYKDKYPELSAALRAGKDEADGDVENALFSRATGIKQVLKKPMKVKETVFENGKKVKEIERIEYGEEEVYFPPDVNADKFYLENRVPERWRQNKDGSEDDSGTGVVIIPGVEA